MDRAVVRCGQAAGALLLNWRRAKWTRDGSGNRDVALRGVDRIDPRFGAGDLRRQRKKQNAHNRQQPARSQEECTVALHTTVSYGCAIRIARSHYTDGSEETRSGRASRTSWRASACLVAAFLFAFAFSHLAFAFFLELGLFGV